MKKIKNKIARTIINFGKLFVFACLLLPSFAICCLLGSWSTNEPNGTYYDNDYNNISYSTINLYSNSFDEYSSINSNANIYYTSNDNVPNYSYLSCDLYDYQESQQNEIDTLDLLFFSNINQTNSIGIALPDTVPYSYHYINFFLAFDSYKRQYFNLRTYGNNGSDMGNIECLFNTDTFRFEYGYTDEYCYTFSRYCLYTTYNDINTYFDVVYVSIYVSLSAPKYFLTITDDDSSSSANSPVGISNIFVSSSNITPTDIFNSYIDKSRYDSLQENYYTLEDDYETLQNQYNNLQQEYDNLEDQANQWYLEKRYYEDAYNQLANTIDNDIYSIDLVHYNSSDTLYDNYNVVYTFDDISPFIVSNSYLDFNAIKRAIPSLNPPIDLSLVNGIIIKSSIDLSIAQYNMLFNAISSPEYYIGLYYSTKSTANQFVSYPLRVITDNGATYYFNSYSLYDVLKTQGFDNLFSDFTYNKLAIHLTNNNFQYFTINNIKLNSENGYNTGYSKGLLDSANTIASLQNNVNDLENQKIALNDRIETLQRQLDNNLGWHSLFFSMADTPIKVVSGFLDYEILGINLFKALLGILTALAVLWLIKRFTK